MQGAPRGEDLDRERVERRRDRLAPSARAPAQPRRSARGARRGAVEGTPIARWNRLAPRTALHASRSQSTVAAGSRQARVGGGPPRNRSLRRVHVGTRALIARLAQGARAEGARRSRRRSTRSLSRSAPGALHRRFPTSASGEAPSRAGADAVVVFQFDEAFAKLSVTNSLTASAGPAMSAHRRRPRLSLRPPAEGDVASCETEECATGSS